MTKRIKALLLSILMVASVSLGFGTAPVQAESSTGSWTNCSQAASAVGTMVCVDYSIGYVYVYDGSFRTWVATKHDCAVQTNSKVYSADNEFQRWSHSGSDYATYANGYINPNQDIVTGNMWVPGTCSYTCSLACGQAVDIAAWALGYEFVVVK